MMSIIEKYFPDLTSRQKEQFDIIGHEYPIWNERINVISRKDIDNLFEHHILHSLSLGKFFNPCSGTKILDMGTGGGFPGIPLAILWPHCHFHLIDRIGKKIKVAGAVAETAGLTNVTFQHGDIGECREKYDYVVSRAVMRLGELVPLIRKNISAEQRNRLENGLLCLKGGDLADELKEVKLPMIEVPLSDYFSEEFFKTKSLVYVDL